MLWTATRRTPFGGTRSIYYLVQRILNDSFCARRLELRDDLADELFVHDRLHRHPLGMTELRDGRVAVETIIDEKIVREIIPQLKAAGAEGIIEYPLNKVVY